MINTMVGIDGLTAPPIRKYSVAPQNMPRPKLSTDSSDESMSSTTSPVLRKASRSSIPTEMARHQLHGSVNDCLTVIEDKGYVLWIGPKGTTEVEFHYGGTGYDFYLHLDPQFLGVEIYDVTASRSILIYNGIEDLNKREPVRFGSPKLSQDRTFRFRSHKGIISLRLEALPDRAKYVKGGINAFKINFTMTL